MKFTSKWMPFIDSRLSFTQLELKIQLNYLSPTLTVFYMKMMRFFLRLQKSSDKNRFSATYLTKLNLFLCLLSLRSVMRQLFVNKLLNPLLKSVKPYLILKLLIASCPTSLSSLLLIGSLDASLPANYLLLATHVLVLIKNVFVRSSLSYAMRTHPWFVVLAPQSSENFQRCLISSMFSQKSFLSLDNFLKMNKMLSELCALNLSFL